MGHLPDEDFAAFCARIRACRVCEAHLPLGPKPVFQLDPAATLLITSQAPGQVAHNSGIPFSDASGDRLRAWMGVTADEFYDSTRIAIFPMGLCYPGVAASGGDAPPRPECAPLWRQPALSWLPAVGLTLLVGSYAQNHVLGPGRVGERVRDFRQFLPRYFPLPHPSWRSHGWMTRNPWFETDVLPQLRAEVRRHLIRPAA